jgi:hypothetical protein
MVSIEGQQLLALFDEARLLTAPILNFPDAVVESDASIVLGCFSDIACSIDRFKVAGDIAHSLGNLLADYEGQFIDEALKVQFGALYRNLLEAMNFDGQPRALETLDSLVTPIPPSARRSNSQLAIYPGSSALTLMIREAAVQEGFTSVVVNSLDEMAQFNEENYPAAVLVDLELIEHDFKASDVFGKLRQRFDPRPHLFFIGKANDRLKRGHGEYHRLYKAVREMELDKAGLAPSRAADVQSDQLFPEAISPGDYVLDDKGGNE